MSAKRYSDEFKIEAVKQVVERNYKISDVANRLGVTTKSIYNWMGIYANPSMANQTVNAQQSELRKLKSELRRVTEERDILKEAAVYFASESKKSTRS